MNHTSAIAGERTIAEDHVNTRVRAMGPNPIGQLPSVQYMALVPLSLPP
jgi:hypothetical protein